MLVRTKSGNFRAETKDVLLDFLGVKKEAAGPQAVKADVELIASVPFALSANGGKAGKGIPWTLSTFHLDRYGERIDPMGWDYDCYVKNPVIEWAHCYLIPAIGRMEDVGKDNEGLHAIAVFNDKAYDPFGWSIGQRVEAGVILAGSVGFRVIEIEIPDKETAKDGTSLIFRKQELLEFSICNVPANPFALTKTIEAAKTETTQALGGSAFWGGLINNFQGV